MRIDSPQLDAKFRGQAVYIVGAGPSMRLFPVSFLFDKPTIALNQAWRYWTGTGRSPTLGITVHPELLLEYEREYAASRCGLPRFPWAVKQKPPMERLRLDDPRYYVFRTQDTFDALVRRPADTLFIGRGVQQTAMDLAARCGARTLVLVGVDMTDLGGDHHGHAQHVRFNGLPPADVYAEYRAWTRKARDLIRRHHGVATLSLTPFAGLGDVEADYAQLCRDRGLAPLPPPPDTSRYTRTGTTPP